MQTNILTSLAPLMAIVVFVTVVIIIIIVVVVVVVFVVVVFVIGLFDVSPIWKTVFHNPYSGR